MVYKFKVLINMRNVAKFQCFIKIKFLTPYGMAYARQLKVIGKVA